MGLSSCARPWLHPSQRPPPSSILRSVALGLRSILGRVALGLRSLTLGRPLGLGSLAERLERGLALGTLALAARSAVSVRASVSDRVSVGWSVWVSGCWVSASASWLDDVDAPVDLPAGVGAGPPEATTAYGCPLSSSGMVTVGSATGTSAGGSTVVRTGGEEIGLPGCRSNPNPRPTEIVIRTAHSTATRTKPTSGRLGSTPTGSPSHMLTRRQSAGTMTPDHAR